MYVIIKKYLILIEYNYVLITHIHLSFVHVNILVIITIYKSKVCKGLLTSKHIL